MDESKRSKKGLKHFPHDILALFKREEVGVGENTN